MSVLLLTSGIVLCPLAMGVAGSGRELPQLPCRSCTFVAGWLRPGELHLVRGGLVVGDGDGICTPPRESEHIWGLFSCLCLLASCTTGHPGRGLEITPCVSCEVHPLPNLSPKGVNPAGKTMACPPAKDFVAFYLQQGRKGSI